MASEGTSANQSLIDSREPAYLKETFQRAGWVVQTLAWGDYWFKDNVGKLVIIERKTIGQLITDMHSGTLVRQCRTVIEHSDFPILLIEGHWIQDASGILLGSRVTWQGAWNQLATIQDMGCRLQLATSINHAIERIFQLQQYYEKEKHDSALRQVSGDPYVVVLSLINGISNEKAKALEAAYSTLSSIAVASPGQLQGIKGIGEVLAKRIWQFFRTSYVKQDLELWE